MVPFKESFVPVVNINEHFIIVKMMQFVSEDEGNEG
jgi:ribosomal 30S subunit maturation factor RimM